MPVLVVSTANTAATELVLTGLIKILLGHLPARIVPLGC
jgi:hypothetical protein